MKPLSDSPHPLALQPLRGEREVQNAEAATAPADGRLASLPSREPASCLGADALGDVAAVDTTATIFGAI